jgi:Methyltransferase domain
MIEDRLRSLLPRDARRRLARLSRLRWLRKARIARSYGASLWRDPVTVLGFVALDPEVDTFTYDLANEHELVNVTARALGVAPKRVAGLFDEARNDPLLGAGLARRVRWRFDFKRRVRFGRRYAWYAIARVVRPKVIVETGIKDGLGSVLLLRALQRNAAEGAPGRLISFDLYPDKGWLVPDELRDRWQPVFASTRDALAAALDGLKVAMLVHDSDPASADFEYRTALEHAAPRLALVAGTAHHSDALRALCEERGVPYHYFHDRPKRHVSPGSSTAVGIFTPPTAERGG